MDNWDSSHLRAAWIAVAAAGFLVMTLTGMLTLMVAQAATPISAGFVAILP